MGDVARDAGVVQSGFLWAAGVPQQRQSHRDHHLQYLPDPALLRPGRFDREVVVDLPDRQGREAIIKLHTRAIPLAPDVQLGPLAQATPGMSGADLANLANEAALTAARMGRDSASAADFEAALDRITLRALGGALMDEDERRTAAYHEGGHALVAYLLPNADAIRRVTIIPRGRTLGVTQFSPADDKRKAFRTRKETIKAQYTAAQAQVRIGEAVSGISEEMADVNAAVQRASDKTLSMQARANAIGELTAAGTLPDLLTSSGDDVQAQLDQIALAAAWMPTLLP